MICEVYDDKFDALYLHDFYENVIAKLPYNFTNIANRHTAPYGYSGSHRLIGCNVFNREGLNKITSIEPAHYPDFYQMYEILENKILQENFFLSNISVNLQAKEMDGTCHADADEGEDDEYTILVMTNPIWKKEWGPELLFNYWRDMIIMLGLLRNMNMFLGEFFLFLHPIHIEVLLQLRHMCIELLLCSESHQILRSISLDDKYRVPYNV